MIYELSATEESLVLGKAARRQEHKEDYGVPSKRFDKSKTDLGIHVEGMRAEFAVARLLGGHPMWSLSVGGDQGAGDVRLRGGDSVSVKFRAKKGWDFALPTDSMNDFKEDIGVLVYPAGNHFRALDISYWITREMFQDQASITDYGYGPRLAISPQGMLPIETLLEKIREVA